jgi:hypothetical protein
VFIHVEKPSGTIYEYVICRGRSEGLCDITTIPVAAVERSIERMFCQERLDAEFLPLLKGDVAEALEDSRAADKDLRASLVAQVEKAREREARLYDLAADGEIATPTLKAKLADLKMQRATLEERLERTDESLTRGADVLMTYVEMLEKPRVPLQPSYRLGSTKPP